MRRQLQTATSVIAPFFYASLIDSLTAEIAYDDGNGLVYNTGLTLVGDSARISGANGAAMWQCAFPEEDITISCWVRRTGGTGVNFSFGLAYSDNSRYLGAQYVQYSGYWLGTELRYLIRPGTPYPAESNVWTFVTWSYEKTGSTTYRFTFYKNGIKIKTATINDTVWLGLSGSQFAISHNVGNSMHAYYKHFSCYPLLTDEQVADLYDNGGVPL